MKPPLGGMEPRQFLGEFWQRKPCLIRQAFPDFKTPVDRDDLAALAMDELAEARLVSGTRDRNDWNVDYGPFAETDYHALPDRDWTLLVQDVEKLCPPARVLLAAFSFIPGWRLDDLMISFAAPGGSVGPHADQYDVFLLQAEGRREWQIARKFNPALLEDCPLNVLREFEPEDSWILAPGDMLYLPPNVAHYGVALEAGLTCSIGFRAPSVADLLLALGEHLAGTDRQGGRYRDRDLQPEHRAGEIRPEALMELRSLLSGASGTQATDEFLSLFLSRFRLAHEPAPPPEPIRRKVLVRALASGTNIHVNPWTRLHWFGTASGACLVAAGQSVHCSLAFATAVCQAAVSNGSVQHVDEADLDAMLALLNGGHLLLGGGDYAGNS